MEDVSNLESLLIGEKLVFDLCGRILFEELDRSWLQSLIEEEIFSEAPYAEEQDRTQEGLKYLQAWSEENKTGMSDDSFLNLRTDYTHMFVGVGKVLVPVWESVYLNEDRLVFQEETLKVRQWYRRFNLESEKLHQEPDDHIGLELLFLGHLAGLGLEALEKQDKKTLEEIMNAQRDFLDEHLLRWVFIWEELLLKEARTDFYRGIGMLAVGAVVEAAKQVGAKLLKE